MALRPRVRLSVGGQDVTSRFDGRNLEVTVTDAAGSESDTVEVSVDDASGSIAAPRTGASLVVEGGYEETGLIRFGAYTVDQVDYEGWPQRVVISARSANNRDAQKQRRSEAHENTTLGDVAKKIASRHGLMPAVGSEVGALKIPYEGQAEESDLAFLTRLAHRYDATLKITDGRLVLVNRASGKSATGKDIPQLVIRPGSNLLTYRASWKDKPEHKEVEASTFDRKKRERKAVKSDAAGGDVPYLIREPFQDETVAKDAAEAKARKLARGQGSATFEIVGTPRVVAEVPVLVQGVRDKVDGVWSPKRVVHRFGGTGYTTTIECETPGAKKGTSS